MIAVERNERPGCEVIKRNEYREAGRSEKAPSEARDRDTRYRNETFHTYSSKMQYHSPETLAPKNLAVSHSYGTELPRAMSSVRETTEMKQAVRADARDFWATPPRSASMFNLFFRPLPVGGMMLATNF